MDIWYKHKNQDEEILDQQKKPKKKINNGINENHIMKNDSITIKSILFYSIY